MLHIFSAKILVYMPYLKSQSFNDTLTNDIASFEHLGPFCASLKNACGWGRVSLV